MEKMFGSANAKTDKWSNIRQGFADYDAIYLKRITGSAFVKHNFEIQRQNDKLSKQI